MYKETQVAIWAFSKNFGERLDKSALWYTKQISPVDGESYEALKMYYAIEAHSIRVLAQSRNVPFRQS